MREVIAGGHVLGPLLCLVGEYRAVDEGCRAVVVAEVVRRALNVIGRYPRAGGGMLGFPFHLCVVQRCFEHDRAYGQRQADDRDAGGQPAGEKLADAWGQNSTDTILL